MRQFKGYIFFIVLMAGGAFAETLPRVEGELKIDGDLSDPLWQTALKIERFYDIRSGANTEPVVKTIGWLGYDSRYLYVAVRAEDPAPQRIRAPLVPRDRVGGEQDLVQIDIDAQNDGKAATLFGINARGVQRDGIYTETVGIDDFSPDFDFESATRITADAWQGEMRIPLGSIRYAQRDPQTWRITFYRVYPREHRYRMRSAPLPRGETCWLCSAPRYDGVTGLGSPGSLVVTPYATTRAVDGPTAGTERHGDAGLDLKWLAGPSLSVDATLRPDFSQLEADVTQLSVNERFAIFFPEKRPFFMEGADLLASPIQAIHTRTITSPLWGARITGRPGRHAFTLIAAGDRGGGSTIVPGPAFSSFAPQQESLALIGRYRYSLGTSSAGLLFTSRDSNQVLGPDLVWWPRPADRVTAQFLRSNDGHAALAAWDRNSQRYAWNVTLQDIGRGFRADSGFVPQTGVRDAAAQWTATAYPKKRLSMINAGFVFSDVRESDGGGRVSHAFYPRLGFEGWRGMVGELAVHPSEKIRARDGSLQAADFVTASARFLPSRRFPLLQLTARFGEEVDVGSSRVGDGTTLTAFARLQPLDPFYIELTAQKHALDLAEGQLFDALAYSARLTWSFTARSFARLVADGQHIALGDGTDSGFLNATFLYGYRLTWQTSLYAGYGDSRAVEAATGNLGPPRRELFVKASYAVRATP